MNPTCRLRYEAVWVTAQHADEGGEWVPDRDEHGVSYHFTKDAAERAAIRRGKAADCCEWIEVIEECRRKDGLGWYSLRRWTGDFDGLSQHAIIDNDEESL